ncbi:LacI family transcriptional regulator [Caballeronia choica]|jgi:DNA-binding LacI/PurR family transcriptional regulator|uniref:LacI family transcriptional regulator n=1 Tax=Caballeronia choica TaxID=326476 RepID=A0A158JGU9_9BURK|nr:LacI family DNA-binding transcriptional regulator [Caballeronia choica]SAL67689.1 LacI family transcriptional regulator [Caballeronia choica]
MGTTIRDVARAASVSIGTVSRALKNQPGLSEATRVRVVEVAQQLGYDSAQLRTRIRRVTFLLHRQHNNFAVSPFFSHVLNGFEQACRERRLVPSVLTAGPTQDLAQQMRLHAPDAIAVAGFVEPELLAHLHSLNRPTILIDLRAPGFRSVNIDNIRGAALAMQHLFALGRRRVAFIGGSLAHHSISQRALGYRLAYFEAGLLFDPMLEINTQPGIAADLAAADAMERLIAQARAQARTQSNPLPDAVFAYNDAAALAAMRVCLAHGLRVPQDIAFVGFDDIPAAAQSTPPLSTVTVDKEALGRRGVDLLLEDSPNTLDPADTLVPVNFIPRASSGSTTT